jgi:hypothetical protein
MAALLITLTNSPNDLPQSRPTSLDIQLLMRVGPVLFVLSGVSGDAGVSLSPHISEAAPPAKGFDWLAEACVVA